MRTHSRKDLPAPSANVAESLWSAAERRPGHPAVIERESRTTFRALRDRAAAFARTLRERGLSTDDRVAIFLPRGAEAAAAYFGAVAAGGVGIMVNQVLRERQIAHIVGHSRARFLVTSEEMMARLGGSVPSGPEVLLVGEVPVEGAGFPVVPRTDHDVACIVYTSGSTGLPKGVTVTHRNLGAGTDAVVSYLGIDGDDRIASLLPFSFDYGFNQLLCAVRQAATLVVETSPIPNRIVRTLEERSVTVLPAVPPLWLQLLETAAFREAPLPALRAMTNTGGRIPVDAVRDLRELHPRARLFLMYGLTEAFRATYLDPDEVDRRPDSIGRAIPGAEILVVREDDSLCDPGEVGELVQRGPTVALGYWDAPEATRRVFRPHPLRPRGAPDRERVVFSGDLVRRDEEGFLYFVGRRDKMIKTLGYRVSPDEVSDVLYASGQLQECAVTAEPDRRLGSAIVAHLVLRPEGSVEGVREFCRRELPRYMQPRRFEVHAEIPQTPSGKQDLRSLQEAVTR